MKNEYWIPRELRERTRILVVEDNLLNQKLDAFLLSHWDLRYDICDDGLKAIERLKVASFDLILMDIRLPEMDGYETTRIIRNEMGLDVPIIGITAHPQEEEKERCFAAGMSAYLTKPVDEEKLFALIHGYLMPQEVENASSGEEEE